MTTRTKPRDLKAAQRGVNRARLYSTAQSYPFARLAAACDDAAFVKTHWRELASFERATFTTRPPDLAWCIDRLTDRTSRQIEGAVVHWTSVMRLLAGDPRALPALSI